MMNTKKMYLAGLLAALLAIGLWGCGTSEVNEDFEGLGGHGDGIHGFETSEHGAYMAESGFPFEACTECHGEELHGGGLEERSCYTCHNSENHTVYFDLASDHYQGYFQENGFQFQQCFNCHSMGTAGSFGGTCNSECHTPENHMVFFDEALEEHRDWMFENHWQIGQCLTCHNNAAEDGGDHFGLSCSECHVNSGGATACNFCHGDVNSDAGNPLNWIPDWYGTHASHMVGGNHAAVSCESCHTVYESWDAEGHLDQEVHFAFSGLAAGTQYDHETGTCSNAYCHGSAQPVWAQDDGTWNACGSCHGIPPVDADGNPTAPHSEDTGITDCSMCHGDVIDGTGTIINGELHTNGEVN